MLHAAIAKLQAILKRSAVWLTGSEATRQSKGPVVKVGNKQITAVKRSEMRMNFLLESAACLDYGQRRAKLSMAGEPDGTKRSLFIVLVF